MLSVTHFCWLPLKGFWYTTCHVNKPLACQRVHISSQTELTRTETFEATAQTIRRKSISKSATQPKTILNDTVEPWSRMPIYTVFSCALHTTPYAPIVPHALTHYPALWNMVWCLSLASQATLKSLTFWLRDSVGFSCGTTSWDALLVLFRVTAIYWKLAAQVAITVHWKACKCLLAHHAIMVSLNIRQKGKMGNGQATVVFSSWSFHFRELSALRPLGLLGEFWMYDPCS